MLTRRATNTEIFAKTPNCEHVLFRHFTRETFNWRAANFNKFKQISHSKLINVDNVPHVFHRDVLCPVRATHYTSAIGIEFVASIRLDTDYLD